MFAKQIAAAKGFFAWAKSIPSEQDGTGSSSRVIALLCTMTALGGFLFHLGMTHALPDQGQMVGLGVLLGAGHAPYVANQIQAGMTEGPPNVTVPNITVQHAEATDTNAAVTSVVGFVAEPHDPEARTHAA